MKALDEIGSLPDDTLEEIFKYGKAPAGSRFAQHAVIGDNAVKIIAEEP